VFTTQDGAWHQVSTPSTAPAGSQSATVSAGFSCVGQACAGNLDDVALTPPAPTAVTLISFAAKRVERGVRLGWRIASGERLLGFRLYRGRMPLGRELIPAAFSGASARSYSYLDRSASPDGRARYRLQAVALDGTRTWLGNARVR
jgi:hypothetical protein